MSKRLREEVESARELANRFDAVIAVTDAELGVIHYATAGLEEIERIRQSRPQTQQMPRKTEKGIRSNGRKVQMNEVRDLELVTLHLNDGKRPVVAFKISREVGSQGQRICLFFNIRKFKDGLQSLGALLAEDQHISLFSDKLIHLSHREQQVISFVAQGMTSRDISQQLGLTENTVKNHRKRIRERLNFEEEKQYRQFLLWLKKQT